MRAICRIVAALTAMALAALAVALTAATAWAHASLVGTEPADGAVLAEPPAALKLTFSEPVSPLVFRVIGPGGEVISPVASAEAATVTVRVPRLSAGTHVLSWRVISADGHPIGGSLLFSIGAPSGETPPVVATGDTRVRTVLWAAKLVLYVGLFIGIGGAFFRAFLADPSSPSAAALTLGVLIAALIATPISVGLQGLDALDLPLSGLVEQRTWEAGLESAYGLTAIAAALSLFAALFSFVARTPTLARGLALVGLVGVGVALSLSGHAGTVAPRLWSRSAVFLHGVCVALWIGALIPLAVIVLRAPSGDRSLARFSRLIVAPLAALLVSGLYLAFAQLDRLDALWTTNYGLVLSAKLGLIAVLLALAAANRYRLVPRYQVAGRAAARPLVGSIRGELGLALVILSIVVLWRFTPPPRALVASEPLTFHIHDPRAMTNINLVPSRGRGSQMTLLVLDAELRPFAVKEVALVLSYPPAGIEALRRDATSVGEATWQIDDLRIPVAGRWNLRVELSTSDDEKLVIDDNVSLPRTP